MLPEMSALIQQSSTEVGATDDLQEIVVAAIRGPLSQVSEVECFLRLLEGRDLSESDRASVLRARPRFALYRKLVRSRFRRVLFQSLPGTAKTLGSARLDAILDEFVAARGSTSPYLRDVPGEFVDFAISSGHLRSPAQLFDLARFELLSFEIAATPDDESVGTQTDLSVDSKLQFQAAARLLCLEYPVHQASGDRSDLAARSSVLLGYRDEDHDTRFLELSPLGAALIRALMRGHNLGDAAHEAARSQNVPLSDGLLAEIAALLSDLETRGIVLSNQESHQSPSHNPQGGEMRKASNTVHRTNHEKRLRGSSPHPFWVSGGGAPPSCEMCPNDQ